MKGVISIIGLTVYLALGVVMAQDRYFGWQAPSMNPGDYVDHADAKKALTDAYKWYRENKDKEPNSVDRNRYNAYLLERDEIAEGDDSICIECPRATRLTKQVNDVLKAMAKDPALASTDLVEQIGGLEAMYSVVMAVDQRSKSVRCERRETNVYEMLSPDNKFEDNKSVLVMTRNIDARHISSIQLRRPGEKNIYYYRGKGLNRNRIVRVVVDDKNQAKVDYFVMRTIDSDRVRDQALIESHKKFDSKSVPTPEEKKCETKKNDRIHGYYESFDSATDPCQNPDDRLKVNYGVAVETNGANLPKRIVLLEAEGKMKVTEGLQATMKGEVSTRRREVQVGLTDDKNDPYLKGKLDDQGRVEVGVPYKFNVYATDILIKGEAVVVGGSEKGQKANLVLNYDKVDVATIEIGTDTNREFASIGHSSKVGPGTFSVKYETSRQHLDQVKSQGVWARYSVSW